MAIAIIAFGIIAAATIASPDDASAKSCKAKKYSHCHGTKGYYTKHGHHHCFKGESKDCYKDND
jgi:hypothetical protein